MRKENGFIVELDEEEYFVFGSNLNGSHAGGAARKALEKFGAINGKAVGMQGQSYAIPTLDADFKKLPLLAIKYYLKEFAEFAEKNQVKTFYLTPIGTGIAGFSQKEIKSILPKFSKNVVVDKSLL